MPPSYTLENRLRTFKMVKRRLLILHSFKILHWRSSVIWYNSYLPNTFSHIASPIFQSEVQGSTHRLWSIVRPVHDYGPWTIRPEGPSSQILTLHVLTNAYHFFFNSLKKINWLKFKVQYRKCCENKKFNNFLWRLEW